MTDENFGKLLDKQCVNVCRGHNERAGPGRCLPYMCNVHKGMDESNVNVINYFLAIAHNRLHFD